MFSSKESAPTAAHYDTIISSKTEIVGDVKFKGGLQIEGTINGNLIADDKGANVRISDTGVVKGQIHSPNVIVNGTIEGDIHSGEYIELSKKARIKGDVYYSMMEMVLGAEVNGKLIHQPKEGKNAKLTQPQSAPAEPQETDA